MSIDGKQHYPYTLLSIFREVEVVSQVYAGFLKNEEIDVTEIGILTSYYSQKFSLVQEVSKKISVVLK